MKILQIAPQVPYPPSDGGKVGIFNITRHLSLRGHDITLFALDRSPGTDYEPLREYCDLRTFPLSTRSTVGGALANLLSDTPYTVSKYRSGEFLRRLCEFAANGTPDVVHADHLHMAAYAVELKRRFGLPAVLREHNVESVIMERFAVNARNLLLRGYARLQHARLREYEARLTGLCDACCPITEDDAARLRAMNPSARLHVVPGGVEKSLFLPPDDAAIAPGSIVFFGGMDWPPNSDAVLWFLGEIFPAVLSRRPDAVLTIVGGNVPQAVRRLEGPHCVVRGYVDDLRGEIQRHAVSVAPFRIGGGMRLKIIESFAMRVPVVATPVGCEGIGAVHGEHLLLAHDAPGFADAVVRLLDDRDRRDVLRESAWRFAGDRYRWETVAGMFEEVYNDVLERREVRK